MTPDLPLDSQNLWETPPLPLDPELVATSQRLVALSAEALAAKSSSEVETKVPKDPHVAALERRNQYLFTRNVRLVAKVAELEAVNLRLQEEVSAFKQTQQPCKPWYQRWFSS